MLFSSARVSPSVPAAILGAVLALAAALPGSTPAWAAPAKVCFLNQGPRAGRSVPVGAGMMVGAPCGDGAGSMGRVGLAAATAAAPRPRPPVEIRLPRRVEAEVGATRRIEAGPERMEIDRRPLPEGSAPPTPVIRAPRPAPQAAPVARGLVETDSAAPPARRGPEPDAPLGSRLFTPPLYNVPKGYGAVAVIAFAHPPADDVERKRYLAACAAFVTVLPDAQIAFEEAPSRPQMVTLWPREDLSKPLSVRAPPPGAALDRVCAEAVDNFAYVAADGWLSELPRNVAFERARRGPFLVAWAPPSARGQANVPILRYDLSDFADRAEFVDSLTLWKNEIEDDPDLWSRGWDLTRWRLRIRTFSDHYAEQIFAGLKLVPGLEH
jgi:hypothetical protein